MKKDNKYILKIIIFSIVLFIVFICAYVIYNLFFMKKYKVYNFDKEIVINYKDEYKIKHNVCYGTKNNCEEVTPVIEGEIDTNTIGNYNVKYIYNYMNKELVLDQVIEVKDISGPEIIIKNEEDIIACPNGKSNIELEITDNYDEEVTNKTIRLEDNKIIIEAVDSNNNKSTKEIDVIVKDEEAPKITINGNKNMSHILGVKYNDKGVSVTDNCDDNLEVTTSGEVNVNKEGTYSINYSVTDSSGNKSEATRKVTVKQKTPGTRVIYLTFDDGPSSYTNELLDVLKKYNVKATFFVTCKGDDSIIKREYNEGHTVALHTCSHDYKQVYASYDAYFKDLNNVKARVKKITGYDANIIRFPGGTSNSVSPNISMKSLAKQVVNKGYYYFDWNISSGDAGGATTSDAVYNNVTTMLKSGTSVVLQHDTKKFSIQAVERIIQYGLANGYTFERLTTTSPKIRHSAGH